MGQDGVKEKCLCIGGEREIKEGMTATLERGRGTRAKRGAGCGACGPANGVQRPALAAGGSASRLAQFPVLQNRWASNKEKNPTPNAQASPPRSW